MWFTVSCMNPSNMSYAGPLPYQEKKPTFYLDLIKKKYNYR